MGASKTTTTPKTILSVGAVIRDMLLASPAVVERTNKIYPVVTDKAELPYILYRRASNEQIPVKSAAASIGSDTARIEVLCFTEKYADGLELAEAVREALDRKTGTKSGVTIRSCTFADGEESWQDDAYIQELDFNVKV